MFNIKFSLSGFVLSLALLAITSSCKEDDPKVIKCYLQKVALQIGSTPADNLAEYEYKDGKIASMTNPPSTIVTSFMYDSKNNLIETSSEFNKTKYYYDSKNQLVKAETSDAQGTLIRKSEYTDYNSSGLLTGMKEYAKTATGDLALSARYKYSYSTGSAFNLISEEQYDSNDFLLFSNAYEYDNKKGFLSALPYTHRLLVKRSSMAEVSDNNFTKVTSTDFTNDVGTLSYTFEYNENGYPVKRTLGPNIRYFTYDCK